MRNRAFFLIIFILVFIAIKSINYLIHDVGCSIYSCKYKTTLFGDVLIGVSKR